MGIEVLEEPQEKKSKGNKAQEKKEVSVALQEELKKDEGTQEKPFDTKKEEIEEEKIGQLAIDVYETEDDFVLQSTIAGIKAGDLNISIENEVVTIGGSRQQITEDDKKKYFYQECYWGPFSRQVILPEEIDATKIKAIMKDGVLTLRLPKIEKERKRKIMVKQEE